MTTKRLVAEVHVAIEFDGTHFTVATKAHRWEKMRLPYYVIEDVIANVARDLKDGNPRPLPGVVKARNLEG